MPTEKSNVGTYGCDPCGTTWDVEEMGTVCYSCGHEGMPV